MNSPEMKVFIRDHASLFWDIKADKKEDLSMEAVLETVLNYGDLQTVKRFFGLVGVQQAAEMFRNVPERRKNNYLPLVRNFFTLYFARHA